MGEKVRQNYHNFCVYSYQTKRGEEKMRRMNKPSPNMPTADKA